MHDRPSNTTSYSFKQARRSIVALRGALTGIEELVTQMLGERAWPDAVAARLRLLRTTAQRGLAEANEPRANP